MKPNSDLPQECTQWAPSTTGFSFQAVKETQDEIPPGYKDNITPTIQFCTTEPFFSGHIPYAYTQSMATAHKNSFSKYLCQDICHHNFF